MESWSHASEGKSVVSEETISHVNQSKKCMLEWALKIPLDIIDPKMALSVEEVSKHHKLGHLGNPNYVIFNSKQIQSMPQKRIQTLFCKVNGCSKDLSSCKHYHKRHRVCELHSKTPKVIVNGFEQRFCQQCSRFHLLDEFDDGKRSCRQRLAGHNERRRKNRLRNFFGTAKRTLPSYNDNKIEANMSFICRNILPSDSCHRRIKIEQESLPIATKSPSFNEARADISASNAFDENANNQYALTAFYRNSALRYEGFNGFLGTTKSSSHGNIITVARPSVKPSSQRHYGTSYNHPEKLIGASSVSILMSDCGDGDANYEICGNVLNSSEDCLQLLSDQMQSQQMRHYNDNNN